MTQTYDPHPAPPVSEAVRLRQLADALRAIATLSSFSGPASTLRRAADEFERQSSGALMSKRLALADGLRQLAYGEALRSADDCDLCADAADELAQLAGGPLEVVQPEK